jgi:hypothetical protein
MLIVGVTSGLEREEKLPSILCGGGGPKGYKAEVLTKPWHDGGASLSGSSLLVLVDAFFSSIHVSFVLCGRPPALKAKKGVGRR